MKRKLTVVIMLVLLASLLGNSAAFAQAPLPERLRHSGRRFLARVTALGENEFTATNRDGKSCPLQVDENTRFWSSGHAETSFDDLVVGQWAIIIASPRASENAEDQPKLTARLVVLLPQELDLSQRFGIRTRGVVTAVNLAARNFEVRDLNGQILTLAVGENTHFSGQVKGLGDLQPGMNVAAIARARGKDYPQAILVFARFPLTQHAGRITAVDQESGTFNLNTVRNGTLTFQVNDQTRFRGLNQSLAGLEDLEPGMLTRVAARQKNGELVALLVVSGKRPILQRNQPVEVNP